MLYGESGLRLIEYIPPLTIYGENIHTFSHEKKAEGERVNF